jgi:hypothetical protein
LLAELGASSLPPVVAVVNAHHAATERDGVRDGVRGAKSNRWLPFQGGHYRLPGRRHDICEYNPLSPDGEIHLGPGWRLLRHGALAEAAGRAYRANASHNAGLLYHEYGHHVTRHTADFRANAMRRPDRQNNRKTNLDEAICDYWAAVMLGTPHIWAWHHRHDAQVAHPRSLSSAKTMADFDSSPTADAHHNGTIFGAALWNLRARLAGEADDGGRTADLMVLKTLLLLGRTLDPEYPRDVAATRRARDGFGVALELLLRADEELYDGRFRMMILQSFAARGVHPDATYHRRVGASL